MVDKVYEWLIDQGVSSRNLPTMWHEYLRGASYTGALSQMKSRYFKDEGSRSDQHFITNLSTGPTLWTPSNMTTALWVDASDASTLTLVGGNVSQWSDKSGNNRHLTQSTASLQATYDSANSDLLNQPAVVHGQGKYWDTVTAFQRSFFMGVMSYRAGAASFDQHTFFDSTDSGAFGQPRILGQASRNSFISGSRPTSFRKNGGATQSSTAAVLPLDEDILGLSYSLTTNMRLLGNPVEPIRGFNGPVGELILLSAEPTETERQLLEGYLAHKWGTVSKLPSNHPYKTTAPTV